jgi:hypothetical protein
MHPIRSIQEFAQENPAVVKAFNTVVTPSVAGVALASLLVQVPVAGLLNFLQLLFLQPLLLVGYGKRVKAGMVYNSLSKQPIDLALVRLVDNATGRIIQSRVTNKAGLFFFQAPPGKYRIEVTKDTMQFPSKFLARRKVDGRRNSIYHGEVVTVTEKYPLITPSIPVDPVNADKTLNRLTWELWARRFQTLLGLSGVLVTLFSIALHPASAYLYVILALHSGLFLVFRRLAVPPKPKGWGIVYDTDSKRPLGRSVARLFNTEFNKLVGTQVTDSKGRYYFLAGDSEFQVRFEHPEYKTVVSKPINLAGKESEPIDLEVGLLKDKNSPASSDQPKKSL